jgi:allophanate hydrolase
MQGLPLNAQLTSRGAWRLAVTRTAPCYRLYALPGGPPSRPGLVRVAQEGEAIEVEVWRMPREHFASFMQGIPAPLGIGRVQLASGSEVPGFLCEACAVQGATDITWLGSWRSWLARNS